MDISQIDKLAENIRLAYERTGPYQLAKIIHRIVVLLFLLHYLWKGFLLITDKKDTLAGYTNKTRIAEMLVALLFMVTGFYMIATGPALSVLMYIKIALVFASIPLAVIGFKRGKKPLAILSILFLIASYGLAEVNKKQYAKANKVSIDTSATAADPIATGKAVYTAKCVACHGAGGDAGLAGAKNLKITQLTDDQQKDAIKHGIPNTGMSAFPDLTDDQLNGTVAYIKTLK